MSRPASPVRHEKGSDGGGSYNKVPKMAQEDHAEFCSRFVTAHPDVILLDAKEQHKKFVENVTKISLSMTCFLFMP